MSDEPDYHHRQLVVATNICNLLYDLCPSTYDEITPRIEYWIEYVLNERLTTTADLVDRVSSVAWDNRGSHSDISRFLKEFRDAPHRSCQARSFVDDLCLYIVKWFAVASAEDLWANWSTSPVSKSGGPGFLRAASFAGHLIGRGLLSQELVQWHLFKPLTAHYYNKDNHLKQSIRANAIYQLFTAAGSTLLQGLLGPEDVQDCFEKLETRISLGNIKGLDAVDTARLKEFREIHATWLQRKNKEGQTNATAIQVPMGETETPVAFVPQDLPTTHIGVDVPSSALQDIEHLSELQGIDSPSDAFIDVQASTVSSPTFTVSTISDFTPTELGEDIAEEQIPTRHETFYLEDGNVEIVCGRTIFRIHSPIVSFSSSRLRDMLSRSTLLDAPMPEGCHRIVSKDSAEDFAVLLKMIYTPGFPAWGKVLVFTVFASLLRMAAKYGFSDVREQLVDSLKGAYPTKWEAYQAANVLGEDVFGSPKPHPNTVLNLFLEQNVKFAIPFATYRAALGGFSSLISNEPGTVLPRLTLAFTIYGMETIRRVMIQASHSIVYNGNLKVCPQRACALSVGISPMERRMEVLKKICSVMVYKSKDDILSPLPLGGLVCVNCAKLLEDAYSICRERFVWSALPSLLGAGGGRESV